MTDDISFTPKEMEFLRREFKTANTDEIIEILVEQMIKEGKNPMTIKEYVVNMIKRSQC